jgi:hypothetical protein
MIMENYTVLGYALIMILVKPHNFLSYAVNFSYALITC